MGRMTSHYIMEHQKCLKPPTSWYIDDYYPIILWNIKNVWNHQPADILVTIIPLYYGTSKCLKPPTSWYIDDYYPIILWNIKNVWNHQPADILMTIIPLYYGTSKMFETTNQLIYWWLLSHYIMEHQKCLKPPTSWYIDDYYPIILWNIKNVWNHQPADILMTIIPLYYGTSKMFETTNQLIYWWLLSQYIMEHQKCLKPPTSWYIDDYYPIILWNIKNVWNHQPADILMTIIPLYYGTSKMFETTNQLIYWWLLSHYIMEHQKCLKPPTSWYIDDYYPIILWNVKEGLKPPTSWYIDDYYPIILWNIKNVWNHQPADILMTIIPLYYGTSKMFETTNQLIYWWLLSHYIMEHQKCLKPPTSWYIDDYYPIILWNIKNVWNHQPADILMTIIPLYYGTSKMFETTNQLIYWWLLSHYIMEHQKCLKPPTSWYIDDYYPIILWNVKKGLKPPTSWYIDDYYPIILWNIKNVWNHQPADILMTIIPLYYGTSKMFETTNQLIYWWLLSHYIMEHQKCLKPPTSWYIDDYYPIILWNIKNVWNHQPADILMTIIPLYYGTSKMFETTNQLLFISPTEQCSKPTCCPFWSWLVNRIPRKNGWLRWSSPSEIASKSRYSNKVVSPLLQQLWFIGDVSMSMSDGLYRLKKT